MSILLRHFEADIAHERCDLDAWFAKYYSGSEPRRYNAELDIGYPTWARIESLVGRIFDEEILQQLNQTSVESILFFISRNEEDGRIIAWMSLAPALSNIGKLSYSDFVFLSEQSIVQPDDFCDYQLAACFRKFESLGEREITLLLRFFQKKASYTRRTVLQVFEHFDLPHVVELATALWQTDDCEFAKLSCLHALKKVPAAKELFEAYLREYRNTFNIEAEDYRQTHWRHLTA